jgi:hypothetical protein
MLFMVRSESVLCLFNRLLMRGPRRRSNQAAHLEVHLPGVASREACLAGSLALGVVCLEEWVVSLEEWVVCLEEWVASLEEWVVCLQGWEVVCLLGWGVVCLQEWVVLCPEEWAEVCLELEVPLVLSVWMTS